MTTFHRRAHRMDCGDAAWWLALGAVWTGQTCPECVSPWRGDRAQQGGVASRSQSAVTAVNAAFTVENGYMTPSLKLQAPPRRR